MKKIGSKLMLSAMLIFAFALTAAAQTTVFTYQGRLTDGTNPTPTGTYNMRFVLFGSAGGADQIAFVDDPNVQVTNGIFTVQINFGNNFPSAGRFLEIRVFNPAINDYVNLSPRQQITSAPFAIQSINSNQLGGVLASNYLQTNGDGSGLTDLNASSLTTGTLNDARLSANVARRDTANTFTGTQTVNGNFSATGAISAGTQYNIGEGFRVLSVGGISSIFAGVNAGSNSIGSDNSFFGSLAGNVNSGSKNTFVGRGSGQINNGNGNIFAGVDAASNSIGSDNSFFGALAGNVNSGSNNTFVGRGSGAINNGNGNTFIGYQAISSDSSGDSNTLIGSGTTLGAAHHLPPPLARGPLLQTATRLLWVEVWTTYWSRELCRLIT